MDIPVFGTTTEWTATAHRDAHAPLRESRDVDVCIVGAGIAGLTCAYMLAREGRQVVVLDDGPVGAGETERTTAHLVNALDRRYEELEKLHGKEGAKLAAESHTRAIGMIEEIVQRESIACDFTRLEGFLFAGGSQSTRVLQDERDAANRAGIGVELLPRVPVDFCEFGACLRFPHQAQFHPLLYLEGLAKAIIGMGGVIHTGTHVSRIQKGAPVEIHTEKGQTVRAQSLIVATNAPINDGIPIFANQAPYRSFVIAAAIPHGSVPLALYWDTLDPFHYVRIHASAGPTKNGEKQDVLIVGGEDHKTGQANDAPLRYRRLETFAAKHFPMIGEILHRWSGQVMESSDGLAFIGRYPRGHNNMYIVTGDSGNGMTHGTIAGMLLTDLICGRLNPWEQLYTPVRFRAATTFLTENANVAKQYARGVVAGKRSSSSSIPLDTGTVLRPGIRPVAAYRDAQGELHQFSAICPHKGAVVAWNSSEKSWDCPCHGSRFDRLGNVLNGPAIRGLKPLSK